MRPVIGFIQLTPDRGEKMSANRFLYIVIALALAVVAVLTAYNAGATSAFSKATGAYDLVEQIRGSSLGPSYTLQVRPAADSTYDRLEELRVQRSVDSAYGGWIEKIEEIRLTRNNR
jgi:hypothetical protein